MRRLGTMLPVALGLALMALLVKVLGPDWKALWHGDLGSLSRSLQAAAAPEPPQRTLILVLLTGILPLLLVPITVLLLGSATLLPPGAAVAAILLGTLLNTLLSYGAGRLFGRKLAAVTGLDKLAFFGVLRMGAREHGLKMMFVSRFLPVPFCVPGLAAACVEIPLWKALLATALTMAPWAFFYVFFTESVRHGSASFLPPALAGLALLAVAGWWVRRRFNPAGPKDGPLRPQEPPLGPELALYTLQGDPACDDARRDLWELRPRLKFEVREVDIQSTPELEAQYHDHVPVVFLGNRKLFSFQVDENVLERALHQQVEP